MGPPHAAADEQGDEGSEEGMESLPLSDVRHIMLQPDFLDCAGELRQHFDERCAVRSSLATLAGCVLGRRLSIVLESQEA